MRKLLFAMLAVVITIAVIAGCAGTNHGAHTQDAGTDAAKRLSIVATIFPPYDFTRAIVGDKADLVMLLPPASESHSFEPTLKDRDRIEKCDVFIYIGGDSDSWVEGFLESVDTSKMHVITLMDCVEVVTEEILEGMQEEEEDEAEDGPEYDEHVWTSPRNAKLIVGKIADVLIQADPGNAELFRANAQDYTSKLDLLDEQFRQVVSEGVRKTIVFADRFPFRYFANAYGLECYAAYPGCSTETEPSLKTVIFLEDKITNEKIPVVFHIELSNENMANSISEQTGAIVLLLHACHNISKSDFESGKTYIDLMTANVAALREALS